jgi:hypothetical protein
MYSKKLLCSVPACEVRLHCALQGRQGNLKTMSDWTSAEMAGRAPRLAVACGVEGDYTMVASRDGNAGRHTLSAKAVALEWQGR